MALERGGARHGAHVSGVGQTLKEFRQGTLKDSHGNKVTSRKHAVAIGLAHEKRTAGDAADALMNRKG